MNRTKGFSLLELVVVIAVIGILVAVSVPAISKMNRTSGVRAAASELRAVFGEVRFRAIAQSRYIGLRFVQIEQGWAYEIYDDGDGDGLRTADIAKGIDRHLSGPHRLLVGSDLIRIDMPAFPLRHPDTGKVLDPDGSPVRFGKSKICSFSPLGSSSSGTIYLTDGQLTAAAVRVYGPTARVRTLRYDRRSETWR